MIKSVSIQNFESHEDTTMHFGEGMNLIVGLSNSGKSAIIRALACVVNNRWEKSMVRTGYEFCRVKIETDKGWVECERGEKINRWRCKEGSNDIQEYKSVGSGVPDLATKILGMGERERGVDIKELPNFQFQLEKHYMLSEIDGKKATSNMIARMMDNAIGLGGMEDLIKAISTDLLKDRKWLTEKQQEINELKNEIQDDAIFAKREKLVDDMLDANKQFAENEKVLNNADSLYQKCDACQKSVGDVEILLGGLKHFDKASELCDLIDTNGKKLALLERCLSLQKQQGEVDLLLGVDVDSILQEMLQLQKTTNVLEMCQKALGVSEMVANVEKCLSINDGEIVLLVNSIIAKQAEIDKASSALDNARALWKQEKDAEKQASAIRSELGKAEKELHSLMDTLGVCPLCGGELKKKA